MVVVVVVFLYLYFINIPFRLPFLCIFTNSEVQERRSLATQATSTQCRVTAGAVDAAALGPFKN